MKESWAVKHEGDTIACRQFDVMVATACNARCPFCVQEATYKSDHCSDERFLKALETHFADFHAAGGRRVVITGGEPLLVPHRVLAVLEKLSPYMDLEVKALYTNGHRLLKPLAGSRYGTIAETLHAAGLSCINLSVHHHDPEVNARIMGVYDAPDAVTIAGHLRSIHQRFRFNLTLQRGGIDDIDGLVRYARRAFDLGAADVYVRELFDLQLNSLRTDTDRRPAEYTATHRLPVTPLVEGLSNRPDFCLIGEEHESLRDKTEWTFLDLETGRLVYLSRLAIGTESDTGTPYLVLMPDGRLYRGWLGPEMEIDGIGAVPAPMARSRPQDALVTLTGSRDGRFSREVHECPPK